MDGVSEWFDHPPVVLSDTSPETDLQGKSALFTKNQWEDVDGIPVLGEPMGESERLAIPTVLGEYPAHMTNPHPGETVMSGVSFDNNWTIWSHWLWADIYSDNTEIRIRPIVVLDDDGEAWRNTQRTALQTAWEAANPGYYSIGFQWEGDDVAVEGPRGSHSDRAIHFGGRRLVGEEDVYEAGSGEFPRRQTFPFIPPNDLPTLDIQIVAPFMEDGHPLFPDLVPRYGGDATLLDLQFRPALLLDSHRLAHLLVNGGGQPPEVVDVPDGIFDDRAVLLDHFQGGRTTRGTVVWAIIDPREVSSDAVRNEFDALVDSIAIVSTYQPPRYRVRWFREDAGPHRRVYARKDSLAGGAGRVYPQSNAPQTSNRIGGGSL